MTSWQSSIFEGTYANTSSFVRKTFTVGFATKIPSLSHRRRSRFFCDRSRKKTVQHRNFAHVIRRALCSPHLQILQLFSTSNLDSLAMYTWPYSHTILIRQKIRITLIRSLRTLKLTLPNAEFKSTLLFLGSLTSYTGNQNRIWQTSRT